MKTYFKWFNEKKIKGFKKKGVQLKLTNNIISYTVNIKASLFSDQVLV